jgi:hypothetical protein
MQLKKHVRSLKDTCHFYMWIVENFLQTNLYEISAL